MLALIGIVHAFGSIADEASISGSASVTLGCLMCAFVNIFSQPPDRPECPSLAMLKGKETIF